MIFNIANNDMDGRSYIKFGDEGNGGWYSLYNNKTVVIDGKVGIGKIPIFELEVNGTIRAKEVRVELTNWPDYVFSKDYNLRSLTEVSCFIKEHKHLPDVPSAADVENNGVDIGQMNAKLLQKVEELTLYLIQQQETIEKLQQEVVVLQEQVKSVDK